MANIRQKERLVDTRKHPHFEQHLMDRCIYHHSHPGQINYNFRNSIVTCYTFCRDSPMIRVISKTKI